MKGGRGYYPESKRQSGYFLNFGKLKPASSREVLVNAFKLVWKMSQKLKMKILLDEKNVKNQKNIFAHVLHTLRIFWDKKKILVTFVSALLIALLIARLAY